jgi:hypothetical protein
LLLLLQDGKRPVCKGLLLVVVLLLVLLLLLLLQKL